MMIVRAATAMIVGCLFVSQAVCAADSPRRNSQSKDDPPRFLMDFRALKKECDDKLNLVYEKMEPAFETAVADGKTQEEERLKQSLKVESDAITAPAVPKAFALVKQHAAEPAAAEPLVWIAQHADESDLGHPAVALLMEHHLTRQPTLDLADRQRESGRSWVERMLRAQVAAADLPAGRRPRQMLALALCLAHAAQMKTNEARNLEGDAIKLFTELSEKYAGESYRAGVTIGEIATSAVFEIRHLQVGKTAPDIAGEDLDGVPFKLSDYRGRVVMLSFWFSSCGPCMALLSHDRELVERYRARPFALIGVNADQDKDRLKPLLEKHAIAWRSFWCGEKGPAGPIPRAWNVNHWPTIYVIDHAGVIRAKIPRGADLDAIIEKVVAETERALKNN